MQNFAEPEFSAWHFGHFMELDLLGATFARAQSMTEVFGCQAFADIWQKK